MTSTVDQDELETQDEADEVQEQDELDALEPANIEDDSAGPPESFEALQARSETLSTPEVRRALQSLFLVADRPLTVPQLFDATGIPEETLQAGLTALAEEWQAGSAGIVLSEVGDGWQLRTDAGSALYVRRLLRVKPQRLTRAALETLAVIAYRQPVTRPEMEDVRGVDCGAVVKALLDRRLVKILGKKEDVGRPLLYGTTREFLEFFALKDLSGLPTLREFHELSEEHQALVAKRDAPRPSPEGMVEALEDPQFVARMEAQEQASREALVALESAMDHAETQARVVAEALAPPTPAPVPAQEAGASK